MFLSLCNQYWTLFPLICWFQSDDERRLDNQMNASKVNQTP